MDCGRPPSAPFLYTSAAIVSAAVLVVELVGTRILAPWLGQSHYVWTAQTRVDLPRTATLDEALFYVTFQVLDTDRRGSVLPCYAIPSARVYDRAHRRTAYYLPIANNGSVAN